jgi:GNAT superfamily N-acetyltransferase
VARRVRYLALAAWRALGCGDYARVDFRLTEKGEPVILEVNPNPDITPGDGFAAALAAADIAYEEFVAAVVFNAAARLEKLAGAQGRKAPEPLAARGERRAGSAAKCGKVKIRYSVSADRDAILAAAASTRFLREDELAVAAEVLDEALAKGPGGHYQSFTAVLDGRPVGWVCHGPTPCTLGTFDIYWSVVAAEHQGRGIGKDLVRHAEDDVRRRGGRLAIVETNSRPLYEPTRQFYLRAGYHEASRVADFYAPGDDKIIYAKRLGP